MDFNSFLNAGIVLSLITYIGYQLKSIPEFCINWIKRKITFSVTIDEGDELYLYIERWLRDCHQKNYRNIEASLNPHKLGFSNHSEESEFTEDKLHTWQFDDEFIIRYNSKRILITKGREKLEGAREIRNLFLNRYTFRGFWAKSQILSLLEQIIEYNAKFKVEKLPLIWTNTEWGDWQRTGTVTTKDFSNIFFDSKEELLEDLDSFTKNSGWYKKRGITYKRGYLFWGLPGNGKTATIQAIARYLGRDIYLLSLKDLEKDSSLTRLFSQLPKSAILVIEDIDAQLDGRQTKSGISFSIILNCLDGLLSQWGLLTIITTNHPEQLDPALLRRGRIDKRIKISNPSRLNIEKYLENFYEVENISLSGLKSELLPMVKIQDICLQTDDYNVAKMIILNETTENNWGEELLRVEVDY
jgi:hypothetical protein